MRNLNVIFCQSVVRVLTRFTPLFRAYSGLVLQMQKIKNMLLLTEIIEEIWCTRSDSNARPTEPESVALSNWATGARRRGFHRFGIWKISSGCWKYQENSHFWKSILSFDQKSRPLKSARLVGGDSLFLNLLDSRLNPSSKDLNFLLIFFLLWWTTSANSYL